MSGRLDGRVALSRAPAAARAGPRRCGPRGEGARIVGCDLKADNADETVRLVRDAGGEMVSQGPVDLTDEDAVRRWIDFAVDAYGDFDILYNNAAAIRTGTIDVMSREDFTWTLDNEITLVFLGSSTRCRSSSGAAGAIVNIASIAGLVGAGMPGNNVGNLAHCIAKAAVIRMTEVLAVELARFNIRVNGIAPGVVATPTLAPFLADEAARNTFINMGVIPRSVSRTTS